MKQIWAKFSLPINIDLPSFHSIPNDPLPLPF